MSLRPVAAMFAVAAVLLQGCSSAESPADPATPTTAPSATGATDAATPTPPTTSTPTPTPTPTPTAAALTDQELADLAVNEVGRVMVSEWHKIGAEADGDYANTLETFRAQLDYLYDNGLRPVTAAEYAAGTFPIPAGASPVVLTFDDSYLEHLMWADDGVTPHPDSVVGILEAFAAEHEDWRATAVFAFNWPPFGVSSDDEIRAKLTYLLDNGFELSNHTMNHEYLSRVSAQEVQDELGGNLARARELVPEATAATLTLPFGLRPDDESLLASGVSSDGTSYSHDLVFEVGWMPDNSPHHVDYDPMSVMRVQAHGPWGPDDLDWWDWVDWLEGEPNRKFISDGDPATVTYPAGFEEVADVEGDFTIRTY